MSDNYSVWLRAERNGEKIGRLKHRNLLAGTEQNEPMHRLPIRRTFPAFGGRNIGAKVLRCGKQADSPKHQVPTWMRASCACQSIMRETAGALPTVSSTRPWPLPPISLHSSPLHPRSPNNYGGRLEDTNCRHFALE